MRVVVAEKPSVARDLAKVLGANQRRDGYLEGNGWQVTWAIGHLVQLKTPDEYDPALKRWSMERLPFVPEALRAAADRRRHQAPARGRRRLVQARGRTRLRDRRRARGRTDLPLHPRVGWLCDARAHAPVAQLADRGSDRAGVRRAQAGQRLRRAARRGAEPQRGRLDRRPQRDARLHGALRRRQPCCGASAACRRRCWR
jgi:hypothetical protein